MRARGQLTGNFETQRLRPFQCFFQHRSAILMRSSNQQNDYWRRCDSAVDTLACALPRAAAEVIDRIIATVNGHVILQSDWDEALCYEALLTNRPLAQFTEDDRRAVLDRLIDQELLREQMKSADFPHATDAEVAARVADARKQYPQAVIDEAWRSLLAQYHLTEKDLFAHVRQQIDVMRLVDARLRPAVADRFQVHRSLLPRPVRPKAEAVRRFRSSSRRGLRQNPRTAHRRKSQRDARLLAANFALRRSSSYSRRHALSQ